MFWVNIATSVSFNFHKSSGKGDAKLSSLQGSLEYGVNEYNISDIKKLSIFNKNKKMQDFFFIWSCKMGKSIFNEYKGLFVSSRKLVVNRKKK